MNEFRPQIISNAKRLAIAEVLFVISFLSLRFASSFSSIFYINILSCYHFLLRYDLLRSEWFSSLFGSMNQLIVIIMWRTLCSVYGNGEVSVSFNHANIRTVNKKYAAQGSLAKMGVWMCTISMKFGCQWNSLTLQWKLDIFLVSSYTLHPEFLAYFRWMWCVRAVKQLKSFKFLRSILSSLNAIMKNGIRKIAWHFHTFFLSLLSVPCRFVFVPNGSVHNINCYGDFNEKVFFFSLSSYFSFLEHSANDRCRCKKTENKQNLIFMRTDVNQKSLEREKMYG